MSIVQKKSTIWMINDKNDKTRYSLEWYRVLSFYRFIIHIVDFSWSINSLFYECKNSWTFFSLKFGICSYASNVKKRLELLVLSLIKQKFIEFLKGLAVILNFRNLILPKIGMGWEFSQLIPDSIDGFSDEEKQEYRRALFK